MSNKEIGEYRRFTVPAELHKAINTLYGMVSGIQADGSFSEKEAAELSHWCSLHADLRDRHPFNELIPTVEAALADGVIDQEEREDILWLCRKIMESHEHHAEYYDDTACAIQFLNGFAHGILADGELTDAEIKMLKQWLDDTDYLRGTYPYDELTSIVTSILADGKIEEDERKELLAFLGNLIEFKDSYNLQEADFDRLRKEYSVQGVCALCPEIVFPGRKFVFTGDSYKASRDALFELVKEKGGLPLTAVSKQTDYLIVGNAGNPCWAFSCYGRKIEKAMFLRKQGAKVQIIGENDFWDAVYDS